MWASSLTQSSPLFSNHPHPPPPGLSTLRQLRRSSADLSNWKRAFSLDTIRLKTERTAYKHCTPVGDDEQASSSETALRVRQRWTDTCSCRRLKKNQTPSATCPGKHLLFLVCPGPPSLASHWGWLCWVWRKLGWARQSLPSRDSQASELYTPASPGRTGPPSHWDTAALCGYAQTLFRGTPPPSPPPSNEPLALWKTGASFFSHKVPNVITLCTQQVLNKDQPPNQWPKTHKTFNNDKRKLSRVFHLEQIAAKFLKLSIYLNAFLHQKVNLWTHIPSKMGWKKDSFRKHFSCNQWPECPLRIQICAKH